jgi:carbon monoxide dehydrogenase subunit G
MAEQLNNEFTVNHPIEKAWPILVDVERIAPCLPGAQLQEVATEDGDEVYRGVVKVKLGAIHSQFKGEARLVERDDEQHRARLKAAGRDTGGRGNASAEIVAQATSLSPTSTHVAVTTDLHITGKVAQFGRGIMGDVSHKLLGQFADNLHEMLDADQGDETPAAPTPAETDETAETATTPAESPDETPADTPPAVRKIEGPATDPIDLMEVGGGSIVKRVVPAVVVVLLVLLLLRRRR